MALVGFLMFKGIWLRAQADRNRNLVSVFPLVVAFSLVSFAYSERGIGGGGFGPQGLVVMLMLLGMWILFYKGVSSRSYAVVMFLLIVGVTFAATDGVLE